MLGAQLKILVAPNKKNTRKLQTLVNYSFISMLSFISIHVFVPFRLLLYVEDNTNTVAFFKLTLLLNLRKYYTLWLLLFECLVSAACLKLSHPLTKDEDSCIGKALQYLQRINSFSESHSSHLNSFNHAL